jgi:hypothetical protein
MATAVLAVDTDGDGCVTKADATLIYDYILGVTDESVTLAQVDVNADGIVNTADVVEVYNHINRNIPYVTFSADAEQTMRLSISGSYTLDNSLQYSVGGGEWIQLTASTPISLVVLKGICVYADRVAEDLLEDMVHMLK